MTYQIMCGEKTQKALSECRSVYITDSEMWQTGIMSVGFDGVAGKIYISEEEWKRMFKQLNYGSCEFKITDVCGESNGGMFTGTIKIGVL
jgi:hypothetical protein